MEFAYFSNIRSQIIPCLRSAYETIDIAMAWFTSQELFEELLNCLNRGVCVNLVLLDNAINYMEYAPDFNKFINLGGNLRIAGEKVGFMHHKFCIIDKMKVITGSYNWTYYAENRNVENIVITGNNEIVTKFALEFDRLYGLLTTATSCKRISWDEIEEIGYLDFNELNYEIEQICEIQKKPVKKIFSSKVQVVRTEITKSSSSKYDVGILTTEEKNKEPKFCCFINNGLKLPCSKERTVYVNSKIARSFYCQFVYIDPNDAFGGVLIKEVDFMQVVQGISEINLEIKVSVSLDDNGSLRMNISCPKTGKKMTVSVLTSDFVKYE